MSTSIEQARQTPTTPKWLKVLGWTLAGLVSVILLYNAATTSVWEDESNGYFLAKRPLGELIELMLGNCHEDPPLYDVLLHGWIRTVGHDVLLLRSPSIVCWFLMLPGLFLCVRRLAGQRTAWVALVMVLLAPCGWLLPASMRWYSLFACLCLWNFYFFLRLGDAVAKGSSGEQFARRLLALIVPYTITGALLWYTNYSAPVLFLAHGIIALVHWGPERRILVDLVVSWLGVGLLYLPWLPTFLSQLGASPEAFSPARTAMSVWVLLAGEFSTPFDPWAALGVGALAGVLCLLVLAQLRRCWIPALVLVLVLSAMSLTGVIWTKRVVFLVPLVAMTMALALERPCRRTRWLAAGQSCLWVLVCLVGGISLVRMVSRQDWLTCRWLDPHQTALARVGTESPDAVILTNSNPVFFYLDDEYGKVVQNPEVPGIRDYQPAALVYPMQDHLLGRYEPLLDKAETAVYIHHAAGGPFSPGHEALIRHMQQFGFQPVKVDGLCQVSLRYMAHHPRFRGRRFRPIDRHRLVMVYFARSPQARNLLAQRLQFSPNR